MYLLGINCWLHDSAACLIRDGEVVAAVEEERWFRDDKHTGEFPKRSIRYCIEAANDPGMTVDHVAFNFSPMRAFSESANLGQVVTRPGSYSSLNRKSYKHLSSGLKRYAREARQALRAAGAGDDYDVHEVAHHDAHAASAFFVSPFDEAAVLTLDGRGEWATTTGYYGKGNRLERVFHVGLPYSLGLFYAAMTEYLGFKRNNDEYKVMGLASYGDPSRYREQIKGLILPDGDGFRIATEHFEERSRILYPSQALEALFGGPRRVGESEIDQRHKDVAAALQERTEEIGLHMARCLKEKTGARNIAMAGGVALNCVMNTRILNEVPFDEIYVQPAAYDAGGALGAPYWVYHQELGRPRTFVMDRANFGPEFSDDTIEAILKEGLLRYRKSEDIAGDTAKLLNEGKIVGWFQGRGEFGPRALGHRSILADPSRPEIQDPVNLRVKHREDFRPFAPSAIEETYQTYFDTKHLDPFMTSVVPVHEEYRSKLPAITHVDGTARLQTVSKATNPLYHEVISKLGELTGIPVVLNTSFNVRGEPMVCTPKDALRCFFTTGIDHLAIGSFIVDK
ncbi:MAG: carbamoyltransferase [Planctomycetes bacterium]|nr:carbamoyltransferase [Planctomycetota bacterium]